jgi:hypothetical protein
VRDIGENDGGAEEKDGDKPPMAEVEDGEQRCLRLRRRRLDGSDGSNHDAVS